MSIEKSEMKQAIFNDVGADVEDMLESAQAQCAEHRGAKKALEKQALQLLPILKIVDEDLEKGTIEEIMGEPLKVAEYAKRQIARCIDALKVGSVHEGSLEIASQGSIVTLKAVMTRIQKKVDVEKVSAERLEEAEAMADETLPGLPGGNGGGRPMGMRPPPSVAQQRKTEEQKEEVAPKGSKKPGKQKPLKTATDAKHSG